MSSRTDHESMNSRHPPPLMPNGHLAASPSSSSRLITTTASSRSNSVKERLQNINSSMSWIREELEELKESDRTLMDIFKQLEGDVAELTDNISNWRLSGSFSRPLSTLSESEYSESPKRISAAYSLGASLEPTLTSTKEEEASVKTGSGTGSDSMLAPDVESTSNSCSPVLPPLGSNSSTLTRSPVSSSSQRRQASMSPPLKGSASMNKIANSPSISRLQDETSSNISRNSSIDSGIQFASEAENSSANGVEATVSSSTEAVSPSTEASSPPVLGATSLSTENSNGDTGDLAAEVFSMLGFKL